jgi:uroporphyrinogen-III synthase
MKSFLKNRTLLLTAAEEDRDEISRLLEERSAKVIHTPLEQYESKVNDAKLQMAFEALPAVDQIIYGYKRNALFFLEQIIRHDKMDEVRDKLNFAVDAATAEVLEEAGIPAVQPGEDGSAIKLIEFMLKINRMGPTLYPTGEGTKEEIPGLLEELEIECAKIPLYEKVGPAREAVEDYQITVYAERPEIILFHNRSSVNRIMAAYPELNWPDHTIVAVSKGVQQKLASKEIKADVVANGSWKSTVAKLEAYLEE